MRVVALTLFLLGLLQAGLAGQHQRRLTLLVRPNELVPAPTRVSVSDCDSLACLAREVKQQLGLDGPEHGLGRRIVLTPALLDGRDAVPVPYESLDEIDDVAKVQLWPAARPEPECEQLLAAERDAALHEQRAAVLEAQAAAANSGQDAGAAHQLAVLRGELAESKALLHQHAAQLAAARAEANTTEARAADVDRASRELREQMERTVADLAHSQAQLTASVDRIATLEAEVNLARARTQRAVEDCEEGVANRLATACTEEQDVIASLKLQQAQQQVAAEECSAALLAKSEEAATAETARQEQADQCAAKLLAAESSKAEAAAVADQVRQENLAAARAVCDDTTKALVEEAKLARAQLHEAERRHAQQLEAAGAQASLSGDDECICVQDECQECPACAACPEPRSMAVECPECPACQTCHPCDCPQCEECRQCPDPAENNNCPTCPEQTVCEACERCRPCPDPIECQQCETCQDVQCEKCENEQCEKCPARQECPECQDCGSNLQPGGELQDGTAIAREVLSKVAEQAQAAYMNAPKLSDVVETVTDSVADAAKAMPHPNIHLPTVELPSMSAESISSTILPSASDKMATLTASDVVQFRMMNVAICVALIMTGVAAVKFIERFRISMRGSNYQSWWRAQTQPEQQEEAEPPASAYSTPASPTSIQFLSGLTPSELVASARRSGAAEDAIQRAENAMDSTLALISLIRKQSGIFEAVPPATPPRHGQQPEPEPELELEPSMLEVEPEPEPDATAAELKAKLQQATRMELQALAMTKGVAESSIDDACRADNREDELIRLIIAAHQASASPDKTTVQELGDRYLWVLVAAAVILVYVVDASLLESIVLALFVLGAVQMGPRALHSADKKQAAATALLVRTLRDKNLDLSQLKTQAHKYNVDPALINQAYGDPHDASARLIELIASARLNQLIASTEAPEDTGEQRATAFHQIDQQLDALTGEIANLDTTARAKKQKEKALTLVHEIQVGLRSPDLAASPRSPHSASSRSPQKDAGATSQFADVNLALGEPGKSTATPAEVNLYLMPGHLGWNRVGTDVTDRFPLCDFLQPKAGGGTGGLFTSEDAWITARLMYNIKTPPQEIKLTFRRRGNSGPYRVAERDTVLRELQQNQRAEQAVVLSPPPSAGSRSPDTAKFTGSPLKLALLPHRGACNFTRVSDDRAMSLLEGTPICVAERDGKITALCDHTGRGVMQQGSGLHYLEFRLTQVHKQGVEVGK